MKSIFLACMVIAAFALSSCTTMTQIKRANGAPEYLIACGAATGWDICYNRANKTCPAGYETVSQQGGFNRKELRIACSPATL